MTTLSARQPMLWAVRALVAVLWSWGCGGGGGEADVGLDGEVEVEVAEDTAGGDTTSGDVLDETVEPDTRGDTGEDAADTRQDTVDTGGDTADASGDTADASGDTADASGDTADASGDAGADTGGDTADASGDTSGGDTAGDTTRDTDEGEVVPGDTSGGDTAGDTTHDTDEGEVVLGDTSGGDTAGDATPDTLERDTVSGDVPTPGCVEDTDCPAPRVACRVARCVAAECVIEVAPDLAPCSDDNVCTTTDRCESGVCVAGPLLACDDHNPCTVEGCNRRTGCTSFPVDGACDDGDGCTVGDTCVEGRCQGGAARACDDGDPCTDDACDPARGCTHTFNTAPCDDGDACTVGDTCAEGRCGGGTPRVCADDGEPCTDAACDKRLGCVVLFNQAPCDDGDACSREDRCVGGVCVGGPEIVCQDAERCTVDGCNPTVGCSFEPRAGACDDGSKCTSGDQCGSGVCQPGAPLVCDDENPCTTDSCSALAGCVAAPREGYCEDGRACTDGICEDGACVSTPPRLWSWHEPMDGQQWLDDVIDVGDGVVLVGTSSAYPVTDARAVKLDYYGREVWTKTYGDSWFYNGAPAGDGLLLAGEGPNPEDPDGRWGGRIVRADRDGELVDEYFVAGQGYPGIWGVAALPGGGVAYGGYGGGFWCGAIDADGAPLWDYWLGGSRSQAQDVFVLANGDVVYLGYDSATGQALAARIGGDGEIAWEARHGDSGDDAWIGAAPRADGRLWVGGWTYIDGGYDTVWGVMDPADGSVLWTRTSGLPGWDYPQRAAPAMDGGLLLAGAGQGPNGYDFLGARVDADGAWVFHRYLGGPGADEGYGVVATREGGMVLVGHDGFKDWRAWRLDPWGHASCDEAGACVDLGATACADGEACTVDRCDAAEGCVSEDRADGERCGVDMTCDAGECVEAP